MNGMSQMNAVCSRIGWMLVSAATNHEVVLALISFY